MLQHWRVAEMTKQERISSEVRALEALDLHGLRDEWRRRYVDPPTMRSVELLARLLAWRIQVDAFGGLDKVAIRLLNSDQVAKHRPLLQPGTRVAREWQGRRHQVDVVDDGFRYAGSTYRSLSQIAREITGTRWNGLRFFGLRDKKR